jgi:xylulokinase/glycerol kinase
MTKSPLFNQIQADCYDRVVERRDDAEATALGAWISAAVRLGLYPDFAAAAAAANADRGRSAFSPDPAAVPVYRRAAAERKRLYRGLNCG